jgi:hypothetical protein
MSLSSVITGSTFVQSVIRALAQKKTKESTREAWDGRYLLEGQILDAWPLLGLRQVDPLGLPGYWLPAS